MGVIEMGAWGCGLMDNDEASTIAADFSKSCNLSLLQAAFDDVLAFDAGYLEAPCAQRGIAAAVLLADLIVSGSLQVQAREAAAKALAVVARVVRPPSELLELWDESDRRAEWRTNISTLQDSLSSQH